MTILTLHRLSTEMDDRVLGLESTATLFMLFATLAALVMSAHPQKGADNLPWYFWVGGICIYIYPIAGSSGSVWFYFVCVCVNVV